MSGFVLPPREQVGYLDPEIAGEGQKVIMSDGEQVSWTAPPIKPVTPDWSTIKSIARYFGRTGHQVYPAWLYHPTEKPRIVKNAAEAAELGVCYREATIEERGRYGIKAVWDWQDGCQWRAQPLGAPKFDPMNPGLGKTYIATQQAPGVAQHQLLEALVPQVAAAVAQALKMAGPAAPAAVDPKEWDAFLQFKAWQESAKAVDIVRTEAAAAADEQPLDAETEVETSALNKLSPEADRELWEAHAKERGIKVDGRWSLDRLKAEIDKAEAA